MSSLPEVLPDGEAQCRQLAELIRPHLARNPALVGIYSGGAWIAERLRELLGLSEEIGLIDVSFYRDDFAEKGLHPQCKPTVIPFDVEGRHLILVDDVLYTGARPGRRSTSCSTTVVRPPSNWPCWPTAAAVSCRWPQPTGRGPWSSMTTRIWCWASRTTVDWFGGWKMHNPQLNKDGELTHLLSIEGLPQRILTQILDTAESFMEVSARDVKKVPLLRGKSVFNLFFENSTRTRTTFEIAAKRLSADVINLDINKSSTAKGETLLDTIDNLVAMHANLFVVRHASSGAPYLIAEHLQRIGRDDVHVVNAGDGRHAHPTQGLLDMYTIRHYKKDFTQLRVAIVGDILHSRVARSDIHALTTLGVPEVRAIGPETLLPKHLDKLGVHVFHDMNEGLKDVDVVIMLRLQNERMTGALLPSAGEYFRHYGLTPQKLALAKPDAIVMHPGPMNRGVEIHSAVADGAQAVILPQVTFGIAVRMAVMSIVAGN